MQPSPVIIIKPSPIHGAGGFARENILRSTRVIEYIGAKIDKRESLRQCEQNNEFIFCLDPQWDLDGNIPTNPARFLNHSCAPNCEAILDAGRIWIVASRDIAVGEEITFNYGFDLEDYKDHPCRCGTSACAGDIVAEEYFDFIRRQQNLANR